MRIEHAALYVRDLERAKAFFETWFQAKAGEKYHNEKTGFQSCFLSFSDGVRLELMTAPDMEDADKPPARTGYAHLAFSTGSREAADELTTQMKSAGYAVISGPRTTGDGYYESCILDKEGNRIEITV